MLTPLDQGAWSPLDAATDGNRDYPALDLTRLPRQEAVIGGIPVDFPFGLAASLLTRTADDVQWYRDRGYSLLTFKTVKGKADKGLDAPNWLFLDDSTSLSESLTDDSRVVARTDRPASLREVSMANSFGLPSPPSREWTKEVARARGSLGPGAALIVSVVSSAMSSPDALADDFVKTALKARDAGAQIIELNFSCPNVPDDSQHVGELYADAEQSAKVARAVKEALGATPVLAKIGYLSANPLASFYKGVRRFVDGLTAINAMRAEVETPTGRMAFVNRPQAGVSGAAIRPFAEEVARNLVSLRNEHHDAERMTLIAVGGVLTPDDFRRLMSTGVDAVEAVTGAYLSPGLAADIRANATKARSSRRRSARDWTNS